MLTGVMDCHHSVKSIVADIVSLSASFYCFSVSFIPRILNKRAHGLAKTRPGGYVLGHFGYSLILKSGRAGLDHFGFRVSFGCAIIRSLPVRVMLDLGHVGFGSFWIWVRFGPELI
ncbi:hypothetical protein RND81_05G062400 [Saponaria officinalis]|uniref:Uncharacterized protein n=1 Tax=Saponaria officinalis TaxID=3572 RepID=A0AAW1KY27_SAPOF